MFINSAARTRNVAISSYDSDSNSDSDSDSGSEKDPEDDASMETEECDIVPNEEDAYEVTNMFTTCKGVEYPLVTF